MLPPSQAFSDCCIPQDMQVESVSCLKKNAFVSYYFLSQIQSSLKYKYALCLWFCCGLLVNTLKIVPPSTKQVEFSRYCSRAMTETDVPSRKLDKWIDR